MESNQLPAPPPERSRRPRWLAPAGLVLTGLVAGGLIAGSQIAGAQTSTSSPTPIAPAPGAPAPMDPSQVRHGPGEELLTGDLAQQVKDSALAEVPGATVIRVETDADGVGVYEAHLQKDDGTFVTVLFDEDLNVVGTREGSCTGGHGPGAFPGAPNGGTGSGTTTG
jgi:hypothetical protein